MKLIALAAALVGSVVATPASAAAITEAYQFLAVFPSGPNSEINGDFSVSYDSSLTGAVTANAFNSPQLAGYEPVRGRNIGFGQVGSIGNNCTDSGCSVQRGEEQFFLSFQLNSVGLVGTRLVYSVAGGAINQSSSLVLTRQLNAPVPEPASWGMMLVGFGVIGALLRFRRRGFAAI